MSEALIFTTEPKTSTVPDVPFTLDDREYTAHAPKKAAWGILAQAMANPGRADGFQAALTFLDACLELPERMHLEQRLRNRDDDLDIDDLLQVVEALLEVWEPYLGEEFSELTGENRARRRNRARRPAPQGTNGQAARRAPARAPKKTQ